MTRSLPLRRYTEARSTTSHDFATTAEDPSSEHPSGGCSTGDAVMLDCEDNTLLPQSSTEENFYMFEQTSEDPRTASYPFSSLVSDLDFSWDSPNQDLTPDVCRRHDFLRDIADYEDDSLEQYVNFDNTTSLQTATVGAFVLPSAVPSPPVSATPRVQNVSTPANRFRELMPRPQGPGSIQSLSAQVVPVIQDAPLAKKARGRKRGLSPAGKEHARDVRIKGACVRCRRMKEKCDAEQPCRTCMSTARRSLAFPCMKEWPEDRGVYLLTHGTTGHLNELEFFRVLRSLDSRYLGDKPFAIRLRQDLPHHLIVPVQEFDPGSRFSVAKTIFPIAKTGQDYKVELGKLLSPPLVPVMTREQYRDYARSFQRRIGSWLQELEVDKDARWHETFFHVNYGKAWARNLLGDVCDFFHKVMHQGCDAIRLALKTTVLVHMVRHAFYIEPDDVLSVLQRTRFGAGLQEEPEHYVCPEHVDRFIKVLLYPILIGCVHQTMKRYQNLYPSRKVSSLTRDRFLAASLTLLIVAASQQQTAVERGHLHTEKGQADAMIKAHSQVTEIEQHFVQPIFDLWDYKFNIEFPTVAESDREERLPALRAQQFGLLDRFKQSYILHKAELSTVNPQLTLEVDVRTFSATNTQRLLKRFYMHVFKIRMEQDDDDNDPAESIKMESQTGDD